MRYTFLLIIFFAKALPAQDLSGLWKGHISSSEKNLPYELVIVKTTAGYKGYSLITFLVNNESTTILKNVRVIQAGDKIELTDQDILEDNLKEALPRKIRQISNLNLSNNYLVGKYKTEVPKNFRSSSGSVELEKVIDPDMAASPLKDKLTNLAIADAIAVLAPEALTKETVALTPTSNSPPVSIQPTTTIQPMEIAVVQEALYEEFTGLDHDKMTPGLIVIKYNSAVLPGVVTKPRKNIAPGAFMSIAVSKPAPEIARVTVKPEPKPLAEKPGVPDPPVIAKTTVFLPARDLEKRTVENIESLTVSSDSIVISLYDNGEIDGDIVSVLLNGKTVVSNQLLSTTAITKTIYLTPDLGDTLQLVMYAENLGSIPPNTGLLILQDGPVRREIRFSSDLQKNAGILLRRREN